MTYVLQKYADRDMLAMGLADILASALRKSLLTNATASLAVPGGTTPGPIFDVLSAVDLDWKRVTVMLTDERWVPDTHERSNAGLIRSRLLQGPAQKATFLPFFKEGLTAQEATSELSDELSAHLPLSLVLLGMGADMHTASLFPGADGLAEALKPDANAVCAVAPDSQPERRITLSAPVLNGAMDKHLVIFGQDKRDALENAIKRQPQEAPISAVISGGTVHWAP
ncbi:MAG: 6-phosphogluconolactonase [Roseobacter sp.]